jgi:predicted transcriptional regulator
VSGFAPGLARARAPRPSGMLAYVQRTTVKLPDDLDARLRHEAQRRGTTVSQLTREAIEAHLGGARTRRRLMAAAAGASGTSDISERIEEILADEGLSSR